jgi:hypothetical protein
MERAEDLIIKNSIQCCSYSVATVYGAHNTSSCVIIIIIIMWKNSGESNK